MSAAVTVQTNTQTDREELTTGYEKSFVLQLQVCWNKRLRVTCLSLMHLRLSLTFAPLTRKHRGPGAYLIPSLFSRKMPYIGVKRHENSR